VKIRRFVLVSSIAGILLTPFNGVEACGPVDEPDVFVQIENPDNLGVFASGKLGILQRGYDSDEYAIAYRYLIGGRLSEAEHQIIDPPTWGGGLVSPAESKAMNEATRDANPPNAWLLARAKYVPDPPPVPLEQALPSNYGGWTIYDPNYLNCPNPAFQNAILTLNKRADLWGKRNPWLMDWIRGQDAVFSNCTGKPNVTPVAAPLDSPALLRADRAYQLASAIFYAKQYDQAAQQFAAITQDKSSPWKEWGDYLTARGLVRKAFTLGKATDPYSSDRADFDLSTMQSAQKMLEASLTQRDPLPSRKIVRDELNFVRIRTEPEKRIAEICAALIGPDPDPDFAQDLSDLSYVLMKHVAITEQPPLMAWIAAFRGAGSAESAYSTWQREHTLPWLIMAFIKAEPSDAVAPQLLAAGEKVKTGSPAYDTIFYHRVRLLIGMHRTDEARSLLDQALPAMRSQAPSSNENALLSERMAVARDFKEFLLYAPRKEVFASDINDATIEANCVNIPAGNSIPDYCPRKDDPPRLNHSLEFDQDSVVVLNRQTPINLLIEAASSPSLPPNLRQDLVLATWTRTVVLDDAASAAKLAPLLPLPLRAKVGAGAGFPATLAILRNPGLKPLIDTGTSRLASFNRMDDFRYNWWGTSANRQKEDDATKPNLFPPPVVFSQEQQEIGTAQYQHLQQLPYAAALLGQRVIDYAKNHPDDPDVPEALALAVRATHYAYADWGKDWQNAAAENTAVSKAAFKLLHSRYPKSPWTARTGYYY
jgi:hypothetical protein